MEWSKLQKFLDENDPRYSLGRLLSYYTIVAAIAISFILVGMAIVGIEVSKELVAMNSAMYVSGFGGKALSKKYEASR